jgi:hypothetical protein
LVALIHSDPSATSDTIQNIAIDADHMYVIGQQDPDGVNCTGAANDRCWRIEKRNIGPGTLVTTEGTATLSGDVAVADILVSSGDVVTDGFEVDMSGTLIIMGTLTTAGTTDGSTIINIAGNWLMVGGTFVATDSTVIFDGSASAITGTTNFFNLANVTPSSSMTFGAGETFTVGGSLVLDGQATGTRITLTSTSPPARFFLNTSTPQSVYYLSVNHSEANLSNILANFSLDNNTDSGEGEPHWIFVGAGPVRGAVMHVD